MAMAYQCPFCVGETRIFEQFKQLTGHITRVHPDHSGEVDKEKCQVDVPAEPARPPMVEDVLSGLPDTFSRVTKRPTPVASALDLPDPVPFETEPSSGGEADMLKYVLDYYSVPPADIEKIMKQFTSDADYRSPAGLTDCLGQWLPAKHPSRQSISRIVGKVFPQPGKEPARSPFADLSGLANLVTVLSTNMAQQASAFAAAMANMGKGNDNELVFKLIQSQSEVMLPPDTQNRPARDGLKPAS